MSMRTFDVSSFSQRDDYASSTDDQNESISVIDRYSNFDGTYHSTRDVRIEGQVKGTIECQGTVHIAQGASVNARIEADNISVAGDLDGDIDCRGRLQILPSGKVRGKINTVTLVINEGAHYEGELEMAKEDNRLPSGRSGRGRSALSAASSPVPIGSSTSDTARPPQDSAQAAGPPSGNTFIRRFGSQETAWEEASSPDDDSEESSS